MPFSITKPCDLAILDDVDAEIGSSAGIAPGHRIVPHGAGARLHDGAIDRPARLLRIIEIGQKLLDLAAVEQLRVDAVQAHDVAAPREDIHLHRVHRQHDLAALGDHAVEVQLVGQAFPQLHRMLEEGRVAADHVVRADQRCVAAHVAGADVAPLDHRHVGDAVVLGEIIGRGEAMAAAADDHHVIGGSGRGLLPGSRPGKIRLQGMAREGKG
jgi:hypothetical protein